jgi:preprotein translocase subunit YajC
MRLFGKLAVLGMVLVSLTACPQPGGAGGEAGGGDMLMSILPLILIFVVFYFLLIRPQQKKQKAHREMLNQVSRGDDIVTSGGIIGTVVKARQENLLVEIAPDIRVRVKRGMVAEVLRRADFDDDDEEDEDFEEYDSEYEEETEEEPETEKK